MGINVQLNPVTTVEAPAGDPLARWWQFTVLVRPLLGSNAYGDDVGDVFASPAWVEERQVRSPDGSTVTSETRVFLPITCPDVPEGSLVELPPEFAHRQSTVSAAARHASGEVPLPQHVELTLT